MARVTIVAVDANTGRVIRRRSAGVMSTMGKTVTVSAPGYTPQTVTIYPGDGEVRVSLVPRFRML